MEKSSKGPLERSSSRVREEAAERSSSSMFREGAATRFGQEEQQRRGRLEKAA